MKTEFVYTQENLTRIELALSSDRLRKYRRYAGTDAQAMLRLYEWNLGIAQSMYCPLQAFEVSLRNTIVYTLEPAFGIDWYENIAWQRREVEKIIEAKSHLQERGIRVNPADLISAFKFGFWVGLLDRHYENDLWRPHLHQAFPYAPRPLRRKDIYSIVHRIRKLRNRIAHHEPVFDRKLIDDHELILQFVSWIFPEMSSWIKHHSSFMTVWSDRPKKL